MTALWALLMPSTRVAVDSSEAAEQGLAVDFHRILGLHEEEEDVAVGGVQRGGPPWVGRGVAGGGHLPAPVGVDLLHGVHHFVVPDAAVARAGQAA
jgi:hypothetical protein